jgi:hypothetical protein
VNLKEALEEEQTTKESLEETFVLELSKIKKPYERTLWWQMILKQNMKSL